MVDQKHRNAPSYWNVPSYRNVPLFYEYFLGQGMFLKLNKISLIRAKLQECCCFKKPAHIASQTTGKLIKKIMVVLRDRCCQAYPRAATPVRLWIHRQD